MHLFQFCRYLREAPGERTYLPISRRRQEFSPLKSLEIRMFFYYKNMGRGDIFDEKVISEKFVKIKNPTMIQLNRIQLTSQTPSHVEITKMLSTDNRESKIIDC